LGEFYDTISPETGSMSEQWFKGTADAIYQNLRFINYSGADFVIIFGGDHIYKMDVSQMMEYHRRNKADLTVASLEVSPEEAGRFGVLNVDEDLRVTSFIEKPQSPPQVPGRNTCFASMGNYIFSKNSLRS
jgi:glucose-1-phosphate adenylyltransferase